MVFQILILEDSTERTCSKESGLAPAGIWLVWGAITSLALILAGSIFVAPLAANNHTSLGFTIYHAFSYVCHQLPERSFHLAGHPLAVCSRCTGLYIGFAIAALSYPLMRSLTRTDPPARRWLLLAAVPMAVDVGLDVLGLWQNTHLSRATTGLLLGAVAAFFVIPGLLDLLNLDWLRRRRLRSEPPAVAGG